MALDGKAEVKVVYLREIVRPEDCEPETMGERANSRFVFVQTRQFDFFHREFRK